MLTKRQLLYYSTNMGYLRSLIYETIPVTWEAEAEGSQAQGQLQQLSKSLSNSIRPCL